MTTTHLRNNVCTLSTLSLMIKFKENMHFGALPTNVIIIIANINDFIFIVI